MTILLVLEDDAPIRQRLVRALSTESQFDVREAESIGAARRLLRQVTPDLLMTDLRLPDGHGTDLIREVHRSTPKVEILVITVLEDESTVVGAITAGASGYLLKDALPADIVETVRAVLNGHSPVSAGVARFILARMRGYRAETAEAPGHTEVATEQISLTTREIEVLWGIAKGLKYAEIAEELGLSHQTVPSHVKNIFRKLQVHNRSEAIFEACQQRLISL